MKFILIGAITLLLSACAGTVKTYDAQTGKKISSIPAGVAVMQAGANQLDKCPEQASYAMSVDDITKLSASAQAEAVRNIPMMALLGMIQSRDDNCYSAVARSTQEFFKAQSVKYQQWGMVGQAGVIGGFTYLGAKSLFSSLAAASAVGDSYIGELNISGTSRGGNSGGEGVAGLGGALDQNINIGNGTQNRAAGSLNFGEKPINGDGNTLNDNDGGNKGSIF